jgi:hypothetical protein
MFPVLSWKPVSDEAAVAVEPTSPTTVVRVPVLVIPAVPPKLPTV